MAETKATETKAAKKVKIRLPLTRTEKDDVWVAVNGRTYQIVRGKDVEVPASVAEVLKHREEMLEVALQFENEASNSL